MKEKVGNTVDGGVLVPPSVVESATVGVIVALSGTGVSVGVGETDCNDEPDDLSAGSCPCDSGGEAGGPDGTGGGAGVGGRVGTVCPSGELSELAKRSPWLARINNPNKTATISNCRAKDIFTTVPLRSSFVGLPVFLEDQLLPASRAEHPKYFLIWPSLRNVCPEFVKRPLGEVASDPLRKSRQLRIADC